MLENLKVNFKSAREEICGEKLSEEKLVSDGAVQERKICQFNPFSITNLFANVLLTFYL
jgi:hypothetical protein